MKRFLGFLLCIILAVDMTACARQKLERDNTSCFWELVDYYFAIVTQNGNVSVIKSGLELDKVMESRPDKVWIWFEPEMVKLVHCDADILEILKEKDYLFSEEKKRTWGTFAGYAKWSLCGVQICTNGSKCILWPVRNLRAGFSNMQNYIIL